MKMEEEMKMQELRSKATELFLREDWNGSIQAYTHFISFCQDQISKTHQGSDPDRLTKLQKSLCLALCNRAEARSKLRDFELALNDCEKALHIDDTHFKTLVCKGYLKIKIIKAAIKEDQSRGVCDIEKLCRVQRLKLAEIQAP